MEPSTGLSLVVVVVAYRPVSWEGTKPRDSLPALRPINLHSNPCLHPLGSCLLREPESCSLLSFFFFCQSCLWDSSTEIFLGKRGFFHTCRTPAMPHKKKLIIAFVAQCLFKPSQWVQRTNECLPEAVFQTLESEGDFNQPGAKLCAFYCRVVDNGKPPWAAWKEDTRFTDLYLLLTKKKEKEGKKLYPKNIQCHGCLCMKGALS